MFTVGPIQPFGESLVFHPIEHPSKTIAYVAFVRGEH